MSFRSSIFSFDTLRLGGYRPWGALMAFGILATIELLVARQDWIWTYVERSQTGILDVIEARVIDPAPEPVLVLLGNSRLLEAVLPRRLEERLGLEPGTVLNLGITAGAPYDYLLLYRRNRDKLSRAEGLVVAVDDFRLNVYHGPNERFYRFAGLHERVGAYHGRTPSLVLGWVWRTYDAREAILRTARTVLLRRSRTARITEDGRVGWRERADEGPPTIDAEAEVRARYGGTFVPEIKRVEPIRALLQLASADGLSLYLIQVPGRDAYIDAVDRLAPEAPRFLAEVFTRLRQEFPELQMDVHRRASELGIPETQFYDYGHLTLPGARVYTDHLADSLLLPRLAVP